MKSVSALTYKNLQSLAQVMASESCLSMLTEEEFMSCVPLQNTERIIKVLATLYKETKM